jgi:hypothetical protein
VRTQLAFALMGKKMKKNKIKFIFIFILFYSFHVRTDGALPHVDAVKIRLQIKLHLWDKSERTRTSRRGWMDDESGWTDKMDVRTVIFA